MCGSQWPNAPISIDTSSDIIYLLCCDTENAALLCKKGPNLPPVDWLQQMAPKTALIHHDRF